MLPEAWYGVIIDTGAGGTGTNTLHCAHDGGEVGREIVRQKKRVAHLSNVGWILGGLSISVNARTVRNKVSAFFFFSGGPEK